MALSTVFYIGATGYIGGAVLAELVKAHPELKFTALVRNPSHVEAIRSLGVEVVQGSFSDTDLISSHARAADITINSGDSDSIVLNEAILTGQRARVVDDGKPPAVLLHTSGVAIFMDGGKEGKHDSNSKIWNDADEADIRSITPELLHGQVDVPILQAAEKGHTESYIICPAAVVGPSRGPVRANSFFFKFMAQLALAFKKTFYVGEGENVFYTVRLDDLADLYKRVFAHILSREGAKASPYSKYYIAVSTPDTWKHITTTIGAVLARIGKLEDGTAHSVSISIVPPPASSFLGASQHVRGERAKDLGWEPRPVVLEDWVDEGITSAVATLQ
ncbi:NAD-binding protein [Russula emetica]|nr:NAD-binding protein [Russula emetica]